MRTLGMLLVMYGLGWVSGMPQDREHYLLALFPLGIGVFLMTLDTIFEIIQNPDTKRKGNSDGN